MKDDENALVKMLLNLKWFNDIYFAAESFYAVIWEDNVVALDTWVSTYENSNVAKLKTFVYGIRTDIKAVTNSIKYNVSNGIVLCE